MKASVLRQLMVEKQIIARNITDAATIKAFLEVPRELFVPPEQIARAYDDSPLQIGEGQTISQPYIVALMSQEALLNESSICLDVGTGSGYAAAIVSRIAKKVFTIERIESLSEQAQKVFLSQQYNNIEARIGDGCKGWPEVAPFDAIIRPLA